MKSLFDQIERGLNANLYYLALFVALCIPDICSSLESENGWSTQEKYKKWVKKYLVKLRPDKYGNQFNENHIWQFRCSLLHQGRTKNKEAAYQKILFIEPGNEKHNIHSCVVGFNSDSKSLLIDIKQFCTDIVKAGEVWFIRNKNGENYKRNYENLIKRYPNGVRPVFGVPVIG